MDTAPATIGFEDLTHRFTGRAHVLKLTMLELDASRVLAGLGELDLDFGQQRRIILPVGANPPCQDDAVWRFPGQHFAPVAFRPILATDISMYSKAMAASGVAIARLSIGWWRTGWHALVDQLDRANGPKKPMIRVIRL